MIVRHRQAEAETKLRHTTEQLATLRQSVAALEGDTEVRGARRSRGRRLWLTVHL